MHVDAGALRLWVEEHGKGGPAPVVLLHGFTGSSATWAPLVPAFAGHARTVALDLPGHGRSDAPREPAAYAWEACLDQLRRALDALGIGQADVVGYSLGGRLALGLAVADPPRVRRLVLVGSGPGLRDPGERAERRARDAALAARIEAEGVPAFAAWWEAQPLFAGQPEALRQRLRAIRLGHPAHGLAHSLRGLGTGSMPALHARLAQVRARTLLVAGDGDLKFRAVMDAMRDAMPEARRVDVPGAGHACHLERPEVFTAAARAFLGAS